MTSPRHHRCRAAALGDHARPTCRPRSARSRPRCGRGSRPPAAPSRRSSPSSSSASRPRSTRSPRPRQRGETVWPVIDYADIAAGTVPAEQLAKLRRRGCLVVRGHFDARAGARLGPRHRRLRREQPLLRELPRPRRRLLRQRRLQARDLPDLLVAGADAGPAERPDGHASRPSSTASGSTSPTACSGSTPTATRSTPTASAAARRAPTRPASAPTSTPAPSTCG